MKYIHLFICVMLLNSCGYRVSEMKTEPILNPVYRSVDYKDLEFNYNNEAIYGDIIPLTFVGEKDLYSIKQNIYVQNSELSSSNFDDLSVVLLDSELNVIDPISKGLTITNNCNGLIARFRKCIINLELKISGSLAFDGLIKISKGSSDIDIPVSIQISDEYKYRNGVDQLSISNQSINFNDLGDLNSGVTHKRKFYIKNESLSPNYFSLDTSLIGGFYIETNCPQSEGQYVLSRYRSCYIELSINSMESINENGSLRLYSNEKEKVITASANIVTQVIDPTEENSSIILVSSEFFNHPSKMVSSNSEKELLAVFTLRNESASQLPLFYINGSNLEYFGCPVNGAKLDRYRTCNLHVIGNKESIGHLSVNGMKYKINDSENDQLNSLLSSGNLLSGVSSQNLDLNLKNNYKLVLENFSLDSNSLSTVFDSEIYPESMAISNTCSNEIGTLALCQISIDIDPMRFNFGQVYTNSVSIDGESFNFSVTGTSPCSDPSNSMYLPASKLNEDKTACVYQYGKFDSPDSTFGNVRFK